MELAEIRSRDVEIVKAMGWTDIEIPSQPNHDATGLPPSPSPEIKAFRMTVPHFHATQDARTMLLRWIAKQDMSSRHLFIEIIREKYESSDGEMHYDDLLQMMLAEPEEVAEAALRVIREAAE